MDAAKALLATISEEPGEIESLYGISQRRLALHAFSDNARADWSYWPRKRTGVSIAQMTAQQRTLLQALLSSILSAKGRLQVAQIMQLEEVLRSVETNGFQRNSENYTITFFGEPSLHKDWSLRFEGHHVSVNLTLARSTRISATPLFLGAAPASVTSGPMTGFRALGTEEDVAFELIKTFDARQVAAGVRDEAPGEILSTQFQKSRADWQTWKAEIRSEGLHWIDLTETQQRMLIQLIDLVIGTFRPEIAGSYLKLIERSTIRFLWLGSTELGRPHYFRLTAGDFLYEFDNSQGNANHIHTVWRDRKNDLGEDALEGHYRESH